MKKSEETKNKETEDPKSSLIGHIESACKRQTELLKEVSKLRQKASEIVSAYVLETNRLNELVVSYKMRFGDLYFHNASYSPPTPPATIGALDNFLQTEFPNLDKMPMVSDLPQRPSAPPLPDETPWRFRVKRAGVVVGGFVKPIGTVVTLPKHIGEATKEGLEPLGPAE